MEAKDLRIGNYFEWSEFASMGKGVDVCTKDNIFQYLDLKKPIPLNEQWLLDFGFLSDSYNDVYYKSFGLDGLIQIHCNKTRGFLQLWESQTSVILESVHQLQNLYYSLTGNELIINKK